MLDATADNEGAEQDASAGNEGLGWGGDDEEEEIVPVESPYDRPGRWYVVHTYSGYENKVRSNMGNVVASRGIEDRVFEVVIPMEDVVEFKGGKKVTVQKKVFPGYLLVRCDLDDDTWGAIRNTPGVTGFVGPGHQADALVPPRGREHPAGQGGGRRSGHEAQPPPPRVRGGRDGTGQGRPVRRLLRPDRRNQRGPAQVEGAGEHLWTRDARSSSSSAKSRSSKRTHEEEEGDTETMAPKKRVLAVVKIQLEAGSATPAPPVGTALGPHGVQTMEFCKQYNAATESMRGKVVPVDITIYEDRTFSFVLKTSPTPFLLRQAAGVAKGSATTSREQVGTITEAQLADIAQVKLKDLNTTDLEAAKKQVAGTARSMGIKVAG